MIAIPNMEMPKDCKGIELVFIPKDGDVIYCSESMSIGADQIVEIDDEAVDIAQDIIDGCKEFIGKFKVERKESR